MLEHTLNPSGPVSGGPLVADPVPEPAIAKTEKTPDYSICEEEEAARADAPMPQAPASPSPEPQAEAIAEAKAKAKEAAAEAAAVKEEMIDDFIARIDREASAKATRRALQAGRPSSSAAPPEQDSLLVSSLCRWATERRS